MIEPRTNLPVGRQGNKTNERKQSFFRKKELFCATTLSSFLFFLFSFVSFSQENVATLQGTALHNSIRLSYIPVQMPTDFDSHLKPTMGVFGLHYQVPVNNWLYGGVGMYTAVIGDQGGLFALDVAVGINTKIYNNLSIDVNFHFGGGGGYRYLVNDGAFVNPNIGLHYKRKNYSFGVQYSHLNFYTGKIKSNSVAFFVEFPSVLRFANYKEAQKTFVSENISIDNFWKKPATKNVQQVRFDFFFPIGKSKKDNNNNQAPLTNTLYAIGFEYQKYLNEKTFAFVHLDAIYKGLTAGFMDLFIGGGYNVYQNKQVTLFGKLALGAAGGRIAPEGGLMIYPSTGIDINFTQNIALSTHAGYYRALDGDLEAYTLGFGFKYIGLSGGTQHKSKEAFTHLKTQGIRVGIQNQTYLKANRMSKAPVDLQLIALQFNYDLSKTFYLIGEAGFAYDGESGGYAHGLVGLGIYSPRFLNNNMQAYLEGVVGAAGGGGVDTDEGIVIRPTIGLSYAISNAISVYSSFGKMSSPTGNLSATNINIGLSFGLSTLSVRK